MYHAIVPKVQSMRRKGIGILKLFFLGSLPIVSLNARVEENIPVGSPFCALRMMAFSAGGTRSARHFWAAGMQSRSRLPDPRL
jgi:hypothetical protein